MTYLIFILEEQFRRSSDEPGGVAVVQEHQSGME